MLRKIILVLFVVAALAISFGCPPITPDADGDGVDDSIDNCIDTPNPDQFDVDGDTIGDLCDDCPYDINNDMDDDTICGDVDNCPADANPDQADEDIDGIGDECDPCPGDDTNLCNVPTILEAEVFSVDSGCVTYVGDHPVEPGQGHVQTYEFCADGTVTKWWNPDPVASPALPGDLVCAGTWSVNDTELFINTDAHVMGMVMNSTETYSIASTFNGGASLDMFSVGQDIPGNGSSAVGSYSLHTEVTVAMGSFMDMKTVSDIVTTVDVDGHWTSTATAVATCVGAVCTSAMNGTTVTNTSGDIALPGELFDVDGIFVLRLDDAFVLELQP